MATLAFAIPRLFAFRVSISTIRDFETGKRQPITNNLSAIGTAVETAGAIFLADGDTVDGGPGVRLRSL
ncbi:transcriptional regulator [Mesorhizobium sp. M0027]|uniref:transcriptional regulator n=1 Tax=Mesorhizobium sp. M0910 TaxID=2957025 RepID=UPI003336DC09